MSDSRMEAFQDYGIRIVGATDWPRRRKRDLIHAIDRLSSKHDVGYIAFRDALYPIEHDCGFLRYLALEDHPDRSAFPAYFDALRHAVARGKEPGWIASPASGSPFEQQAALSQPSYAFFALGGRKSTSEETGFYYQPGWGLWHRLVEVGQLAGEEALPPEPIGDLDTAKLVMQTAIEQRNWYGLKLWYCMFFWHVVTFWDEIFPGRPMAEAASIAALAELRDLGGRPEALAARMPYDVTEGLMQDTPDAGNEIRPGFGAAAAWWFTPWRTYRAGLLKTP